jgi:hypothetical protein
LRALISHVSPHTKQRFGSPPPNSNTPSPDDTADLVIWTSIESNSLVIASCIPILQPLVDRLRGKHSRAVTPSGRFSPYPGSRPRTLGPTQAAEMSFACRGAGRTRRDLESVSEVEADKVYTVSQESILRSHPGSPSGSTGKRVPDEGIMRTKVITISYDDRRPDSSCDDLKSHPAQWRPRDRY